MRTIEGGKEGRDAEIARLLKELLSKDPFEMGVYKRRDWFSGIIASMQSGSELLKNEESKGRLETEIVGLQVRVSSLIGPRENDEQAWRLEIDNARDLVRDFLAELAKPESGNEERVA
ncbi:MAG: hypothetical protein HY420_01625 [Candidatus Kerfeldbacteria bacterium]|nr:hypothetical protein [Candidatus Kerfeldbacteria bacterium]